jgi:hypothetical protein
MKNQTFLEIIGGYRFLFNILSFYAAGLTFHRSRKSDVSAVSACFDCLVLSGGYFSREKRHPRVAKCHSSPTFRVEPRYSSRSRPHTRHRMDDWVSGRRRLGLVALDRMEVRHRLPHLQNNPDPAGRGLQRTAHRVEPRYRTASRSSWSLCGVKDVFFLFVIIIFVGFMKLKVIH